MHVVLITYGIRLLASLSLFLSFSFPPSLSLSRQNVWGIILCILFHNNYTYVKDNFHVSI